MEPVDPPVRRPLTESASAAVPRLTAALKAAVYPLLPPTTLYPAVVHWVTGDRTHPPLRMFRFDTSYMAFAEVRDSQGIGYVEFSVYPYIGDNPKRPFAEYCDRLLPPSTAHCETRVGPHGELITIETGNVTDTTPVQEYRVDVARADGTALLAIGRNVGADGNINEGPIERPTPPLNPDQMVAVLLSPGLTAYP